MKLWSHKVLIYLLISTIRGPISLYGFAEGHFYRARCFQDEPHTHQAGISTLRARFLGTSTRTSFDGHGHKVPLLSLFGPIHLPSFGIDTPCENLFLSSLFSLTEAQFEGFLNFDQGFFAHAYVPVRSITLTDIEPLGSNRSDHEALEALTQKLKNRGLRLESVRKSGVGDLVVLGGWGWTTYNLSSADFFETELQAGVLFPTSKRNDLTLVTDFVPIGYDGHWAIPLITHIATGYLNWITMGFRSETLFFFSKTQPTRLKADDEQYGLIRTKIDSSARTEAGILWDVSVYFKADHFMKGLSLAFEYTHEHKNRSHVHPSKSKVNKRAANEDPLLSGWTMNIFHVALEYDWSYEDNPSGPCLGLEYNYVINGKHIFNASTTAGYVGLNLTWDF